MEMLKINNETPSERIKKTKNKKSGKEERKYKKIENLSRKSHIQKGISKNKRAEMAKSKKLTEIIQENSHGLKDTCFEGKDSSGAQQS